MSSPPPHTTHRTLSRLFRETVTVLTLLGLLLLDVPIPAAQIALETPAAKLPACCAGRLAARQRTCGCSSTLRTSGQCCCRGRSACGRPQRRGDDEKSTFLSACDCSGPHGKFVTGGQPRIKPLPPGIPASGSFEFHRHAPASHLESLEFEPETPPPRDDSASYV